MLLCSKCNQPFKSIILFPPPTDTEPHGTLWAQQRSSTSLSAQTSLQIRGSREELIDRLASISPSSATNTRNADTSASAAKRPRPDRQEPDVSDVHDEPRIKRQQPRGYPRWRPQRGTFRDLSTRSNTSGYADRQHRGPKLKNFMPTLQVPRHFQQHL